MVKLAGGGGRSRVRDVISFSLIVFDMGASSRDAAATTERPPIMAVERDRFSFLEFGFGFDLDMDESTRAEWTEGSEAAAANKLVVDDVGGRLEIGGFNPDVGPKESSDFKSALDNGKREIKEGGLDGRGKRCGLERNKYHP